MELFFLEPTATIEQLERVCKRAIVEKCDQLTVIPLFVKKAKEFLSETTIQISVPIGYPYGWNAIEAKLSEIILAMVDGADELDLHINITALKNGDWQYLAKELNMSLTVIRKQQRRLNIVLETSMLTEDEITKCCDLYGVAGIDCFTVNGGSLQMPVDNLLQSVRTQLADSIPIKLVITHEDQLSTIASRHALIVK